MAWTPPEYNNIGVISWLALLGLFAMLINVLRQISKPPGGGVSWWQQLAYSLMVGLMTMGLGSTIISIWPEISYWALLGVASLSGYWGTTFIVWALNRTTEIKR